MVVETYQNQDLYDVFVYLVENGKRICYLRYPVSQPGEILDDQWVNLKPDLSMVKLQNEEAGYLKLGLAFEPVQRKQDQTSQKINNDLSKIFEGDHGRGKIVVELISGEAMLPLDEEGSADPFITFHYLQK